MVRRGGDAVFGVISKAQRVAASTALPQELCHYVLVHAHALPRSDT